MRKIALLVTALAAAAAMAGSASASGASGSWVISNNSSLTVNKVADTFSGFHSFSASIGPGLGGTGTTIDTGTGNVYSGTVMYTDSLGTGVGCSFTTVVVYSPSTGKYSFSFSSSPQGGLPAADCSITAARNTSTGTFTAYPVMTGF